MTNRHGMLTFFFGGGGLKLNVFDDSSVGYVRFFVSLLL